MKTLGIDIGYSNLKVAYGQGDKSRPTTLLRPAGAAPADRFDKRIDGGAHEDYLHVLVDDEPFIAGVPTDRATMWTRSLHPDYPTTPSYTALFHAALLLSEMEKVDTLVTGLPVSQFMEESRRQSLAEMMRGQHQVTRKRTVNVESVRVVPQPVGGFLDYIAQTDADVSDARVLVIDPGFFSVDWVVIANNDLQRQSSGTSTEASSVVLEQAARLMAEDHGSPVSVEKLENAIRAGKEEVVVLGSRVQIAPYVQDAKKLVAPVVVESIRRALRKESDQADLIVLVGGGATFFREAIVEAFPRRNVAMTDDAVFANARGFYIMGTSSQ